MPKKTDTREKVFAAADGLLKEGTRPTQQNIRERIGSGSITTINSALNGWWLSLSDRINRKDQYPELPDPVISAANQLWDQALAYSHHAFNKERAENESLLLSFKAENTAQLAQLRSTIDQLQQQNTQLRQSSDELNEQRYDMQQKLLSYETKIIKLSAQRDEINRENKQLKIIQRDSHSVKIVDNPDKEVDYPKFSQQSNELFEARVDFKVNVIKINNLENLLKLKEEECQALKNSLLSQEKAATQQQHRLELVIAQQDARYDDALNALNQLKERADKSYVNPSADSNGG